MDSNYCVVMYLSIALLVYPFESKAADSVTLTMSGVIEESCIINAEDTVPFDFSNELSHSAGLDIDCNQQMLVALRSDYGGMRLIDSSNEMALVTEYQIEISIDSLNFFLKQNSKDIIEEQRFVTGSGIPFKTSGNIQVSLFEPLKFAGEYRDTLHIDVYPNFVNNGM